MAHYYSENQDSEKRINKITATLCGFKLEFQTVSGTFSLSKVDRGTQLLIESAIIQNDWTLLDLGCGWGPVGITFAKMGLSVTMTDVNRRAVEFAKKNAMTNKVKPVIVRGDSFEKIKGKFDTILLNPPQTAGKDVCFSMIKNSIKFLKKRGLLQIVARHTKGGKHLSEKMKSVFGNVIDIAKKSGYRVYVSKRET